MKKLLAALIAIAIVVVTCAGCTKKEEKTEEVTAETITVYNFPQEPEAESIRAEYLNEVKKRNANEEFFSEAEIAFLEQEGYTVGKEMIAYYDQTYKEVDLYWYPVLWMEYGEPKIAYISDDGDVEVKPSGRGGSEWYGNVHTESEHIIVQDRNFSITYDEKTGEIQVWSWGEKMETHAVPAGSIYAGFSEFEGYIFRHNTDVYALKTGGTYMVNDATVGVQVIAHNVKQVIDADYYLSSDPWCQPLFQMTDGSVKAYVGWEGDKEKPDSATHLVDIRHEGGYDK